MLHLAAQELYLGPRNEDHVKPFRESSGQKQSSGQRSSTDNQEFDNGAKTESEKGKKEKKEMKRGPIMSKKTKL